ncbi:MAG: NAD(P)H-hydrate dehydratase [Desulfovibrionaceae bacterium]|nr:NAD(P)H-hydrate dehydratase [Desulfovibrionaceae bacterium]
MTPPPYFQPLPTPAEMAAWDRMAVAQAGIRPEVLMENAGLSALAALEDEHGPVAGKSVLVFAGAGNNGGDAFVLARHLFERRARVRVLHTRPKKKYRGHTRHNLLLAQWSGLDLNLVDDKGSCDAAQPDIVVDGLLGTGLSRGLDPRHLNLIRAVNRLGERAFVLALDIPSGLSGLTGRPCPEAVRADLTATFGEIKLGLALPEAAPYVGRLRLGRIGIPGRIKDQNPPANWLITPEIMDLLPLPQALMHKGDAGRVLVVGGSQGLTGAAQLAALGALRAGSGLVTVACPAGLCAQVKAFVPEIMVLPLGPGGHWNTARLEELSGRLDRFDVVVAGPGLGRTGETGAFVRALAQNCPLPLLLDADALFHLAGDPELLKALPKNTVLTPHPGEMARLANTDTASVQAARLDAARDLAVGTGCVVALKGAGTIVADPEGRTRICPLAEPNLAVGGSGDVLSGVVGSLLARGLSALPATCLGVYWHALCGRLLKTDNPLRGNLAQEIAAALPAAAKEALCKRPKT